jgi:NAD(P)-dependent dehydrogenase (short-subunit alcohol dehydrogenase family)
VAGAAQKAGSDDPMDQAGTLTCVITGAASGLGLEAARQLAGRGMRVIGVGRSSEECRAALDSVRRLDRSARARFIPADLSTIEGVRRMSPVIRSAVASGRLDRLIHGADTFAQGYVATADGLELQFAVNYLAAFLLTHELFPLLVRPPESRVITVSSGSHRGLGIAAEDLALRRRSGGLQAYRRSQLALALFTFEFNRRVSRRFPVRALAVDPGPAAGPLESRRAGSGTGLSAADAATSIVRLATEPASAIAGNYWRLGRPFAPSPRARRPDAAKRLWDLSEELCRVDFL